MEAQTMVANHALPFLDSDDDDSLFASPWPS
jgi:hypothetical protein